MPVISTLSPQQHKAQRGGCSSKRYANEAVKLVLWSRTVHQPIYVTVSQAAPARRRPLIGGAKTPQQKSPTSCHNYRQTPSGGRAGQTPLGEHLPRLHASGAFSQRRHACFCIPPLSLLLAEKQSEEEMGQSAPQIATGTNSFRFQRRILLALLGSLGVGSAAFYILFFGSRKQFIIRRKTRR